MVDEGLQGGGFVLCISLRLCASIPFETWQSQWKCGNRLSNVIVRNGQASEL